MNTVELDMAVQDNMESYLYRAKNIASTMIDGDITGSNIIEIAKMIQKEEHRIVDQYYETRGIK